LQADRVVDGCSVQQIEIGPSGIAGGPQHLARAAQQPNRAAVGVVLIPVQREGSRSRC
jgi:cell division GTPase FtsZ